MRNSCLMIENAELLESRNTQYLAVHDLSASLFELMSNLNESQIDTSDSNLISQNEISIYDEANVLMNIFSSMNNIVTQNKKLKGKYKKSLSILKNLN